MIRTEPRDQDMIDGKVQALADHYCAGRITEYVLEVSLRILLRDADEARYQLNIIKGWRRT